MIKKIILIFALFFFYSNKIYASQTVLFYSNEGQKRIQRSKYKNDFYQLVNFFQPQENKVYCSAASATMILNSIYYNKIKSTDKFKLFTQDKFFNKKTDEIKRKEVILGKKPNDDGVYDAGLSLSDLNKILQDIHNLHTRIFYARNNNEKTVKKFRKNIKKALKDKTSYIIVNFDGKILNKPTNGHISPITAYDKKTDSVLIMDVAVHKNKWYFVKVQDLFNAMNTKDGENYRGYIVIKK